MGDNDRTSVCQIRPHFVLQRCLRRAVAPVGMPRDPIIDIDAAEPWRGPVESHTLLSINQFIYLFIYLFVYLFIYLFVHLFIRYSLMLHIISLNRIESKTTHKQDYNFHNNIVYTIHHRDGIHSLNHDKIRNVQVVVQLFIRKLTATTLGE
eukprot:GHVU01096672.1.p1 GENE.GHVU01096672.1~~GHVU01096672.1.p1  ORF type:complete len:151 (-),score=3.40 GHVU01096672.1:127-579(-)